MKSKGRVLGMLPVVNLMKRGHAFMDYADGDWTVEVKLAGKHKSIECVENDPSADFDQNYSVWIDGGDDIGALDVDGSCIRFYPVGEAYLPKDWRDISFVVVVREDV